MRLSRFKLFALAIFCFLGQLLAKPAIIRECPGSPGAFVQNFYDWYAAKANASNDGPTCILALKQKRSAFDPLLVAALIKDCKAQSKSSGDIVGLDFDPFLNTQDPAARYAIGKMVRRGQSYFVNIHELKAINPGTVADVVAEVKRKKCQWVFINFHYQNKTDLVTVLKLLEADREKARTKI